MLTVPQMQALLDRITYRPGWTFDVYQGRHEGPHLVIRTSVADAYNPDQTTVLDVHSMLPPMRDEQQFMDWLLWRCSRLEVHEAREFLRVDGKPHSDPHGPDADHDL